ncbi:hypothetical protein ES703_35056 [subsurface metagenome]
MKAGKNHPNIVLNGVVTRIKTPKNEAINEIIINTIMFLLR